MKACSVSPRRGEFEASQLYLICPPRVPTFFFLNFSIIYSFSNIYKICTRLDCSKISILTWTMEVPSRADRPPRRKV